MKAKETNFLEFLRGPKQLVIPIYQRTYSWTRKQCQQLWDDILRVATQDNVPAHFIGSVVYISDGIYQATSIPRLLVIDGQQRLTTLSLLLSALAKEMDAKSDGDAKRLRNYFLINNDEENEMRFKLMLTRSDKETYIQIIEGMGLNERYSPGIYENYRFFENLIRSSEVELNTLYHGISKLVIVDVSLNRDYDNPQLIFESLNSTGLDLSQADLIRNYILMGLEVNNKISCILITGILWSITLVMHNIQRCLIALCVTILQLNLTLEKFQQFAMFILNSKIIVVGRISMSL